MRLNKEVSGIDHRTVAVLLVILAFPIHAVRGL
jgi:hypothetical protein